MNLDKDDSEIQELLYRYFRKELTEQQEEEVNAWRSKRVENQQQFEEVELLFLNLKGMAYYRNVDQVDQSWDQFKEENSILPFKKVPPSFTLLKYAASVAVVAAVALGVYYFQSSPETVTLASGEAVQEVMLADSSRILLDEEASIDYVSPFQNNERRVELTGRAHFNIERNADQPFVVEVGEVAVRVLGTEFFIQPVESEVVNVIVEEGKVLVSYKEQHEIVAAGQSLQIDLSNDKLSALSDPTGLATFWKNRKLIFNLTSVEEAVQVVNQAYGSAIQLTGNTEGCALTVTFEDESLENVLEIISSTLGYTLVEEQGTLILKGDGCQ